MKKWIQSVIPCLRKSEERKYFAETSSETITSNDKKTVVNNKVETVEPTENVQHINTNGKPPSHDVNQEVFISCKLQQSLQRLDDGKVVQTSIQSPLRSTKVRDSPKSILVFKTFMLNGEPCTTQQNSTSSDSGDGNNNNNNNNNKQEESAEEKSQDVDGTEIRLVFSRDVLEYLTKSFFPHNEADGKEKKLNNNLVVCTLFPKQTDIPGGCNNEMDVDNVEQNYSLGLSDRRTAMGSANRPMDVDEEGLGSNLTKMQIDRSDNYSIFSEKDRQKSPKSQILLKSGKVNVLHTSTSANFLSTDNNILHHFKQRKNLSKKVSWKENVEVCFFNRTTRSAGEVWREVRPLVDHETYYGECVGENDRKRREVWLRERAMEQKCVTGDGEFHDYFIKRLSSDDEEPKE